MTETPLKYLSGYSPCLQAQVQSMIDEQRLGRFILDKYPSMHNYRNDSTLRGYVLGLKSRYIKKSVPLNKVVYDNKIHVVHNALGLHSYVSRVQGGKIKSKNEIRIGAIFINAPEPFLKMIAAHELSHLKEKEHNKAFYKLCQHIQPDYHQVEFDVRLYLTQLELYGEIYSLR